MSADPVAIAIFIVLFVSVAAIGLFGGRWRAGDLSLLSEWGLGGRRFGTVITWFLLGGDLYTAYTFIAVPALMFGAGAAGFFRDSLCHPDVPAVVRCFSAPVVGGAQTRLCHRR
jgi:solute:Na+ symporter, SSS family